MFSWAALIQTCCRNRITEWVRLKGTTVGSSVSPYMLNRGHPREHCTGLCTDGSWISLSLVPEQAQQWTQAGERHTPFYCHGQARAVWCCTGSWLLLWTTGCRSCCRLLASLAEPAAVFQSWAEPCAFPLHPSLLTKTFCLVYQQHKMINTNKDLKSKVICPQ